MGEILRAKLVGIQTVPHYIPTGVEYKQYGMGYNTENLLVGTFSIKTNVGYEKVKVAIGKLEVGRMSSKLKAKVDVLDRTMFLLHKKLREEDGIRTVLYNIEKESAFGYNFRIPLNEDLGMHFNEQITKIFSDLSFTLSDSYYDKESYIRSHKESLAKDLARYAYIRYKKWASNNQ